MPNLEFCGATNTMIKILRWLAVLPAAIIAVGVVSLLGIANAWMGARYLNLEPGEFSLTPFIIKIALSAAAPYAGVWISKKVAPSFKNVVGYVLAALFSCYSIFILIHYWSEFSGFFNCLSEILQCLAVIIGSLYAANDYDLNF